MAVRGTPSRPPGTNAAMSGWENKRPETSAMLESELDFRDVEQH